MSYPFLKTGDKIPAVGVAQKLLNARAGSSLVCDGIYGPKTANAARNFQRPRGLGTDGIIGEKTWGRLKQMTDDIEVIDCIDIFDPDLLTLEAGDIARAGGNPILIGGMSNGVEQAVMEVIRAARMGKTFLLRFHGHGAAGVAGISTGHGVPGEHAATVRLSNWNYVGPIIARLKPIFGPYGCIQFMHCETGRGPKGEELLQKIAEATNVPVTAGINTQFGGGLTTFRFEGPTRTAFPSGYNLKTWSVSRPDFAGMTVP